MLEKQNEREAQTVPSLAESLLRRYLNKGGVGPETNELRRKYKLAKSLINRSVKIKKKGPAKCYAPSKSP